MRHILPLTLIALAAPALAQTSSPKTDMTAITYPATDRGDTVDDQFGVKVAAWVESENKITDAYLATLPGRDMFKDRLKKLIDYERFGQPERKGGRYFYLHNTGLQNQAVLFVRDGVDGQGRVLMDPNGWSKDGATALGEWAPSEDGKKLVYAIQDGGTDWRTVKVLDVDTGKVLDDDIEWVKFSGLSWAKDGSGFYYSRFAAPPEGKKFQSTNENQTVYFHKLGTPQSADPLIYATPDHPKWGHGAGVTDDGKWLVIYTTEGTDNRNDVTVIDLTAPNPTPRKLFTGMANMWGLIGNQGGNFFWLTNKDAPRNKVVMTNLYARSAEAPQVEIVPQDKAVLDTASLIGGKLIGEYMVDVKSEVRRFTLDGKPDGTVALPGIGAAGGFGGEADNPETFFTFTSYTTPTTIYRYDVASGKASIWAQPKVAFDPAGYEVTQVFYPSKDKTTVPMFIVRKKGATGPAPTLLYAYSPYHNIRAGKPYPAILAATADTDDRVVPGHTFKYTAMLQSIDLGPKPRLVRIETRAGHGSGKPTDKIIDETAIDWAFIAKWTGLEVKPIN